VGEEEITRIRNKLRADLMRSLQSNEGMAAVLAYYAAIAGDWRYVTTHLDHLEKIRPEDLRAVAARYLLPENRTVAILVQKGEASHAP
jgi:predicted Zn-dependent peptidase